MSNCKYTLELESVKEPHIKLTDKVITIDSAEIPAKQKCTEKEVTVVKKQYKILGDDQAFFPTRAEDAPAWLQTLIQAVTDSTLDIANGNLEDATKNLNELIKELDVAKNTYENSIISSDDIDQRILTAISSLRSTLQDADSTILNIAQTATTPDEARAIVGDIISSQLNDADSSLGSVISDIRTTTSTADTTIANSLSNLESSFEGEFAGTATAVQHLQTFAGIDGAGARTGTGLAAYVEGTNGVIGEADSNVANNVYVDAEGNPRTKWEYNSTITVNGVSYVSGFGMNLKGTGTDDDPFDSEFLVNADRFRVVGAGQTSNFKAPFTVDAENGIITMNSDVEMNGEVIIRNINDVVDPQTTINGGKITTGSITANLIDANAISGKTISGGTITGTKIFGSNIEGSVIRGSYIDLTSTITLTSWQRFTPSEVPTAYINNFAKDNDGNLVEDNDGYARLPGNANLTSGARSFNKVSLGPGSHTAEDKNFATEIHPWDSYQINTLNRAITRDPRIQFTSVEPNTPKTLIEGSATVHDGTASLSADMSIVGVRWQISVSISVDRQSRPTSITWNIRSDGTVVSSGSTSGFGGGQYFSRRITTDGVDMTLGVGTPPNTFFPGGSMSPSMTLTVNSDIFQLDNFTGAQDILSYDHIRFVSSNNIINGLGARLNVDIPAVRVL